MSTLISALQRASDGLAHLSHLVATLDWRGCA
jgi:hypothetical protein